MGSRFLLDTDHSIGSTNICPKSSTTTALHTSRKHKTLQVCQGSPLVP